MTPAILNSKRHRRYHERVWRSIPTALNRSRLARHAHLCNRQMSKAKSAHFQKLLLRILAIMDHYGRHSTKFYTVALKCIFLIILLLPLWQTHSARFSSKKSLPFALPFHTLVCCTLPILGRLYSIKVVSLPMRCAILPYWFHASPPI